MENNEQGATPQVTPQAATATPAAPAANPQGATPAIQSDTAATIATLTEQRDSANARIKELNNESKGHRLKAEGLQAVADLLASVGIEVNADAAKALKARLESGDSAIADLGKRSKSDALKKAASVAGLNGDLLASLDGAMGVDYITEGEGDKATAKVKYKDESGADKEQLLSEWAKSKWPSLEGALVGVTEQRRVTKLGPTPPAGSGQKLSVYDEIRERNKAQSEKQTKGKTFLEKTQEAGMASRA